MEVHRKRPQVMKRLKRAHGHLGHVIKMLESNEECLKIAQQLRAVINALDNAKSIHVHDHMEGCLEKALSQPRGKAKTELEKFKEIAKYL